MQHWRAAIAQSFYVYTHTYVYIYNTRPYINNNCIYSLAPRVSPPHPANLYTPQTVRYFDMQCTRPSRETKSVPSERVRIYIYASILYIFYAKTPDEYNIRYQR